MATQKPKEKATGIHAYETWLSRLRTTLAWRQGHWNGDKNWDRAYDMFRSMHWRDRDTGNPLPSSDAVRDRITVNITGSSILNIVPFLMKSRAEFVLKPRTAEGVQSAKIQQELLNYEYLEKDMQSQIKKSVYDGVIIGHGVVKTGFVLELNEGATRSDGAINYKDYIKKQAPFIQRINPKLFLMDPNASEQNLETARWCAEIFFVPLPDLMADDTYSASVRNKIKSGEYTPMTRDSMKWGRDSEEILRMGDAPDANLPDTDLVIMYEVWDKKFNKYYIYAENVPEPLKEKAWPYPYLDGFPYIKFDYIPVPNEPYGVGIPFWIEDQQFELNRVRTSLFEHRRRFNRKYEVLKNVDESEKIKLVEGEDGTLINVDQMGSIAPIPDAAISSDLQLTEGIIRQDIQELTGADALIRGGALPSRTTAGEVSTRANLFRLKLDDRAEAVDKFVLTIGTQVLQHIKANYVKPDVVRVVGAAGFFWMPFSNEDIQADVDVSMESIAAPEIDPLMDRQQAMEVLQVVGQWLPLIQAGLVQVDLNQLFKWAMEKLGIKDSGRFFAASLIPQPPLQEQSPEGGGGAVPVQQVAQTPAAPTGESRSAQDVIASFTGAGRGIT